MTKAAHLVVPVNPIDEGDRAPAWRLAPAESTPTRQPTPVSQPAPLLREVYGQIMRTERTQQGRTLTEVAKAAGVSTQYLSEIERGRKEPSSEVVNAVCTALGGSLLDLIIGVHRELAQRATIASGAPVVLKAA